MWDALTWAGLPAETIVCAILGTVFTMVCSVLLRVIVFWEGPAARDRVILFWIALFLCPVALGYIVVCRPFVMPDEMPLRWLMFRPFRPLPEQVTVRGATVLRRCFFSLLPARLPDRYLVLVFQTLTALQQVVALLMVVSFAWATLSYFIHPEG